jgi:hypothetical protein
MHKKPQYDQKVVNANMESLLDLPETPTVQDRMKNIIRSEAVAVDKEIEATEKQSEKPKRTYKKKASTRGGVRSGSGRPKGSTNKITLESLVQSIDNAVGMSFEERLAMNYKDAIDRSDWQSVKDYDKAFLSKIVADKQEVDMTSNGQTLVMGFNFPTTELPEWNNDNTKH